jgi:hypothetical protein
VWCAAAAAAAAAAGVAAAPAPEPAALVPRPSLQALAMQVAPAPQSMQVAARSVPIYRAALLSALLPGLGEYYSGHRTRALLSGTAEAAVWTSFVTFKVQEDLRDERAIEYAVAYAGATPGSNDDYYQAVGQFLRAEGPGMWNEFVRRRQRDTGETVGREYTGDDAWSWPTVERFIEYRQLRKGSLAAGDRATNALAFALVNRIVSVVSVVQAVRSDHKHAERALGLRLEPMPAASGLAWRLAVQKRF